MRSANSSTKIVDFQGSVAFKKTFSNQRVYNFYHEYFISKYLQSFFKKITPSTLYVDHSSHSIFYDYVKHCDISLTKHVCLYEKRVIEIIKKSNRFRSELLLNAKESFTNTRDAYQQIKQRLFSHQNNNSTNNIEYKRHLKLINNLLNKIHTKFLNLKPYSPLVFSHADTGIHNSIADEYSQILLVDLEYSGLDSPIKEHIDYLIHPRNAYYSNDRTYWSEYFLEEQIINSDKLNLNIYNCFFALKWSLIVLNEFLPGNWEFRIAAEPARESKKNDILNNQLLKSEIYLKASEKLLDHVRPTQIFNKSERILLSKSY